ncbi:MAG: PfkB family carbohydrate kinase [Terriglobia bacterium]
MLVQDIVDQFTSQSILVTGDTYLDRELYGNVTRLSPEAPVPVVKVHSKRAIPGGAANIAKNISSLGGKAILLGLFGKDVLSQELTRDLQDENIRLATPSSSNFRLPQRYRIFASHQQLLQMFDRPMDPESAPLLPTVGQELEQGEIEGKVLVVYDQGYGFVNPAFIQSLEPFVQSRKLKLLIDANPSHVAWYGKASLYTFNAEESLQAAQNLGALPGSVEEAGALLRERLASDILITMGSEGMLVFEGAGAPQKIPATRVPLADRVGAGDSSTAVLALCLSAGVPLLQAAELANKAAGIVVAKPGIAYVTPAELVSLFHQEISHLLMESVTVKQRLLDEQLPAIEALVKSIIHTYQNERTVYSFGNGGSAADANHFITELVGRFRIERKPLPALSFSANEILMTSIANDYGYENTFARQVDAFVKEGDLVVAFSTSGKSRNVVLALELARAKGAHTVGFTGKAAGEFPRLCDICIRVPSDNTPRIQESHLAVVHIICELLEQELAHRPN